MIAINESEYMYYNLDSSYDTTARFDTPYRVHAERFITCEGVIVFCDFLIKSIVLFWRKIKKSFYGQFRYN